VEAVRITELDESLRSILQRESVVLGFTLRVFCRAGSSLHPDSFTPTSDIDYFLVVDKLYPQLVNELPDRVTPELEESRVGEVLHSFYWRVGLRPVGEHNIVLHIYTQSLFEKYCNQRSGPKMYLLHEHRFLGGDETFLPRLREKYPPDEKTARSDYTALFNKKYEHRFLWGWRSVCLLRTGEWLRNKKAIIDWVQENCPPNSIGDKVLLMIELGKELAKTEEGEGGSDGTE
jgi:hypothetical protein